MLVHILSILLRVSIIAAVWISVWRLVEPKTKLRRVLRAAVLAVTLLLVSTLMTLGR